jgi:hypothetical protein
MKTSWFIGVTEPKEEFKQKVLRHRDAWELLTGVLSHKIKDFHPNYDDHSWSHRQAHNNGYNQAIRDVINMLDLTKGDT